MSRSFLIAALLFGASQAYTVISANTPFMNKNIDPLVFPGSYTKSHMHTFFGSDALTANTKTSAELRKGCGNTENPNDLSAYWVPTPLYTTDGGKDWKPVPLSRFSAYYNLGESPAEIAFPENLSMIAGNAKATSRGDLFPGAKSDFFCEGGDGSIRQDANGFPSSTCKTHLQQLLYFPSCVNPTTLETAYKSRDYKTPNWCPQGMKSIPQLRFSIRWDLRKALPNGWSGQAPLKLACGPAWCAHGDFINGWTPDAAQNMVATTRDKREFFPVNGSLGGYKDGPKCKATDAEPSKGTSDYAQSVREMQKREVAAFGWESKSRFAAV
jgi:hypothetical protein